MSERRRPNMWSLDIETLPIVPPGFYTYEEKGEEAMKKYYVGAKHIGASIQHGSNADCTRETIDEAIADAKQQIREGAQCVVVVKIVAVVRRDFPPITVETID